MNTEAYRDPARLDPSKKNRSWIRRAPRARLAAARRRNIFGACDGHRPAERDAGPKVAPTDAVRFPPPPKSTRDLVNDAFGSDPSLAPVDAPRTMSQALWMMNNEQLQKQINAAPGSGTMLSKLLDERARRSGCARATVSRVLFSRSATADELRIVAGAHRQGGRSPGGVRGLVVEPGELGGILHPAMRPHDDALIRFSTSALRPKGSSAAAAF